MEKRIIIDEKITNYTINELGEVKNLNTNKVLKGSYSRAGYQYIRISINGEKHRFYTHRKVAELFVSGYQDGFIVNHINGDKTDNRAENLEWISQSDNVKHAHKIGLIKSRAETEYYSEEKNFDNEIWREIKDFSDYKVSNYGRVISYKKAKPIFLKPSLTNGYLKVILSKEGKTYGFLVHHLVYTTFAEDIIDFSTYCIDHKDNDALNNRFDNLRKVTHSENVQFGFKEQKAYNNLHKVAAYKDGKLIGIYNSCREAGRELNLDSSSISKVCRGIYAHTHDYIFKYLENNNK